MAPPQSDEGLIPLYGFLEGDTIGLLILGRGSETVAQLLDRLRASASVRVVPAPSLHMVYGGQVLAPTLTLHEAGFQPLERFDARKGAG